MSVKLTLFALLALLAFTGANDWDPIATPYPVSRRSNQSYVYPSAAQGQVTVPDPYDYLENLDSNETIAFRTTQLAFTQQYLDTCTDLDFIRQQLNQTFSYERYLPPVPTGIGSDNITYYYRINRGTDAGDTWYAASLHDLFNAERDNYDILTGTKFFNESLLDPNGTFSLEEFKFSPSGKYFAYGISESGSDGRTFYFRETSKPFITPSSDPAENAKGGPDRLPDVLDNAIFTNFHWTADEKGGFYKALQPSNTTNNQSSDTVLIAGAQFYYHYLGTDQKDDITVVAREKLVNTTGQSIGLTNDRQWLILTRTLGTSPNASVYLAPLDQGISSNMSWLSVTPNFAYSLSYVHNVGNDFYWLTDANAPNKKIVRTHVDPSKVRQVTQFVDFTDVLRLEDVVPESKEAYLQSASVYFYNKLLVIYSKDVKSQLYQYDLETGKQVQRLLPDFEGRFPTLSGSLSTDQAFLLAQSLTISSSAYRLSWSPKEDKNPKATPSVYKHRTTKFNGFDLSAFVTEQVFVPSTDNVTVPMYIVYRNDTPLDGTAPSFLHFYGAYGTSLSPTYDPARLWFVGAYGVVLLWPGVRGGAEKGEEWWNDGRLFKKKNTFKDIIASAQYAVDHKYAASGRVIADGRSAGGLAALAVGNMAPEGLFGAVLANVPVSDMLRADQFTVGVANAAEFGSAHESGEMFDYLYSYSPLHNVNASKVYAMTICSTADHDDRVPPLHSYKMTAQLQYSLPNNPNPLLLRVNSDAGHALASTPDDKIDDYAEKFAMLVKHLGLQRK